MSAESTSVSTPPRAHRAGAPQPPGEALRIRPGARELRSVLGAFATGVTVVTAGRTAPCGMTANSFSSVSLDPPLVLVCVKRDALLHGEILANGAFAVSVLSSRQEPEARYFADHARPRGDQEFAAVRCAPGPRTGAPVLQDALAWLECRLAAAYDGGSHSILLGSVLDAERQPQDDALVFYRGGFRRLASA
ncbi:MAG TPA: flavin reductase family protein [Actinocrinis sp.]|jgi:flavin reductase (DIM6/NTAB) family NADH-FMN oxidoreductase RutF